MLLYLVCQVEKFLLTHVSLLLLLSTEVCCYRALSVCSLSNSLSLPFRLCVCSALLLRNVETSPFHFVQQPIKTMQQDMILLP